MNTPAPDESRIRHSWRSTEYGEEGMRMTNNECHQRCRFCSALRVISSSTLRTTVLRQTGLSCGKYAKRDRIARERRAAHLARKAAQAQS